MDLSGLILEKQAFKTDKSADECMLAAFSSTKPVCINTAREAAKLSARLGEMLKTELNKLNEGNLNPVVQKSLDWIRKKAVNHPAEVYAQARLFAQTDDFCEPLEKQGYQQDRIREDLKIIAILHDIGRLGEINLQTGSIINMPLYKGKGFDHAFESAAILQRVGINRPEIVLPIKFHGVASFTGLLEKDELFSPLPVREKYRITAYTYALRDLDKLANIISKSKTGIKGCAETNNPRYCGNYQVSEAVLNHILKKEACLVTDEKTYGDAILRFISWTYSMHYPAMQKQADRFAIDLWSRLFEEIYNEYNASSHKDIAVLNKTISSLQKAMPPLAKRKCPLLMAAKKNGKEHQYKS